MFCVLRFAFTRCASSMDLAVFKFKEEVESNWPKKKRSWTRGAKIDERDGKIGASPLLQCKESKKSICVLKMCFKKERLKFSLDKHFSSIDLGAKS